MSTSEEIPRNQKWTTKDWEKLWDAGDSPMRVKNYNEQLLSLERTLFPEAGVKYTVLVPLCAMSYDMEWLARKGHSVIGLDCSEAVLKNFFKEQDLEYSERSDGNFKVFYSTNPQLNISLYTGDIFDLPKSSIPQCNAVWDYASIVVIKPEDREKYVRAITSRLSTQANYLLCTFDFEKFEMPNGPAYHTTPEMVQELFGSHFEVKYLKDIVSEHKVFDRVVAMKDFFHMVKK